MNPLRNIDLHTAAAAGLLVLAIGVAFLIRDFYAYQAGGTLLFILLAGAILAGRKTCTTNVSIVDITILALCLWWLITSLASIAPWRSHLAFASFLVFPLAYLFVRNLEPCSRAVVPKVFSVALLVVAALTVSRFIETPATVPFFANKNSVAAWLAGAALITMGLFTGKQPGWWWHHSIPLVGVFLAGMAVYTIGSRGVTLALGLTFVFLALAGVRKLVPAKPVVIGYGALLLGAATMHGLLQAMAMRSPTGVERLASLAEPGLAGQSRFILWESALPMIRESPWIGIGPGLTELVWPQFRHAHNVTADFHLHNDYLQFAVEGGIVAGFLLLGLLLIPPLILLAKRSPALPTISIFGAAGALAVMAHSLFTYNLQLPSLLLIVGAGLGMLTSPISSGDTLFTETRFSRWPFALATALVIWFGGQMLAVAAIAPSKVSLGDSPQKIMAALGRLETVTRLRPDADPFWVARADLLRQALRESDPGQSWRQNVYEDAYSGFTAGAAANPLSYEAFMGRALLQHENPDLRETEQTMVDDLQTAIELRPYAALPRLLLGRHFAEQGRTDAALEVLRGGLRWSKLTGDGVAAYLRFTYDLAKEVGDETTSEMLRQRWGDIEMRISPES